MERNIRPSAAAFTTGLLAALAAACPSEPKGTDADVDGYDDTLDCDDNDPEVNPGAVEICEDGIDNDCSGGDATCITDADGDGFEVSEDCDDNDVNVNPDAAEDCYDNIDNNCDGVATTCMFPAMEYAPTNVGQLDPYDSAIFADHVVFGEPSVGGAVIGDGRASLFEYQPGAVVDETDAAIVNDGEPGAEAAYGTVVKPVGSRLCIGADYHDEGTSADVGKAYCYSDNAVATAGTILQLADADFSATGEDASTYSMVDAETDVDGDGSPDLMVYTARGAHVILGDGSPWSGDYSVPSGADGTLGDCGASATGWCGFGRALDLGGQTFAIAHEGGVGDTVSLYNFPTTLGDPADATAQLDREREDSATAIESLGLVAFGDRVGKLVTFVDGTGAIAGVLTQTGVEGFGYWVDTVYDQSGHELLLVSNPYGSHPDSSGLGVIYAFDITEHGLPTSHLQAKYILIPPESYRDCGWRARGGQVHGADGSYTLVGSTCPGDGGAVYELDDLPPPAPLVGSADIKQTGPNSYEIRQWVVDAYTSRIEWMLGLANTKMIGQDDEILGWRLLDIAPGSPLHRAGLRSNDLLRRVNGTKVTKPEVVQALFSSLKDATQLTLSIGRNGVPRQLSYAIVP